MIGYSPEATTPGTGLLLARETGPRASGAVAESSGLERWTGDRVVLGSNPAAPTSLRTFSNSVYPALPMSFGGDSLKAVGPFCLVFMPLPGEMLN